MPLRLNGTPPEVKRNLKNKKRNVKKVIRNTSLGETDHESG
ncbi:hypothetical protein [Tannerella forsythia]